MPFSALPLSPVHGRGGGVCCCVGGCFDGGFSFSSRADSYRHAVEINPRDYRAWYGLGQTYELLARGHSHPTDPPRTVLFLPRNSPAAC